MNEIGLYGLGVMGRSLSRNISSKNIKLGVYNIDNHVTFEFVKENKSVQGFSTLKDFVNSLIKPRKIILMITSGKPVDDVISSLKDLLEKGDIIIDAGNSNFLDTIRREKELKLFGIFYFGVGISGGEAGALNGPSIMPGGDNDIYNKYLKIYFDKISAKDKNGNNCNNYIGPNGAGHFVKTIHNGIEYADMQLICEAYSVMKSTLKLNNSDISYIFSEWNKGELGSYLLDITSKILMVKDDFSDNDLIDVILDVAKEKGTGKWTCNYGLDLSVPIPTISWAIFTRYLSTMKDERVIGSNLYESVNRNFENSERLINNLKQALYASKICIYSQGFELLNKASIKYNWNLDYSEIAQSWSAGCIIKSNMLYDIMNCYDNSQYKNILLSDIFVKKIEISKDGWKEMLIEAIRNECYTPCLNSSIMYFYGMKTENMFTNLIQAQRDYFGSHSYMRVDCEFGDDYHTEWE